MSGSITPNLAQKFSQLDVNGTLFSESDYEAPLSDIEIEAAKNEQVTVAGLSESENEILTDLFDEHFGEDLGFDALSTDEQKELRDLILKEAADIADVNDGEKDGNTTIEAILNAVPEVLERYDAPTIKEQALINEIAAEMNLFKASSEASPNVTPINLPDGNQILLDTSTIDITNTKDGQTITGSRLDRLDGQEETVTLQYDQQGVLQTATFEADDGSQTATYKDGRLDTVSTTILNGGVTVSGYDEQYTYTDSGDLESKAYQRKDPNGDVLSSGLETYTYTKSGDLESKAYQSTGPNNEVLSSGSETYTYTESGALASKEYERKGPNNEVLSSGSETYTYTESGALASKEYERKDLSGDVLSSGLETFTESGALASRTREWKDPNGDVLSSSSEEFTYTDSGDLASMTYQSTGPNGDEFSGSQTYTYTDNGDLASKTDSITMPNGNSVTRVYDSSKNKSSETYTLNGTTIASDYATNTTTITTASGEQIEFGEAATTNYTESGMLKISGTVNGVDSTYTVTPNGIVIPPVMDGLLQFLGINLTP